MTAPAGTGGSAGARRRGRECALQILYALDVYPDATPDGAVTAFFQGGHGGESGPAEPDADSAGDDEGARAIDPVRAAEIAEFAGTLAKGTRSHLAAIDELVQRVSRNWRLERMARVDRNVLRLATYELVHAADVPVSVVLNEAIEIARRFGAAESPAFVNGILDRVAQELART
ncbi:MAG: transcription antitermination factor NusB [Myxococcales bacterium]|nr:transcription antitermination factor NusB [Myxococcales bacterium]